MRRLFTLFALAAVATQSVLCAAIYNCGCTNPLIRKEWRTLDTREKHEYISAVKCLASKPSQTGNIYEGAKSRFDDFQASHIANTDFIHYVGFFQAWHRMFIAQYEKDLRNLCSYTGAQPYWNWALDSDSAEDFSSSPIFDGEAGFGAPEYAISKLNQCIVDWTLEAEDFYEFDIRVQGGVTTDSQGYHGGGHLGIGGDTGELSDMYSSPGDPIFFLHHANIDRLWDKWQRLDWPTRRSDISGPDTQYAYPYNYFGDRDYHNVTLDYEMNFGNLIPGRQYVTVKDVMDIQGGRFCYKYR
ncbi:hypothetical protein ACJ41O_006907 [Fusarium nematophilum]